MPLAAMVPPEKLMDVCCPPPERRSASRSRWWWRWESPPLRGGGERIREGDTGEGGAGVGVRDRERERADVPGAIGFGENALAMLGAETASSVSVPVLPVAPSVEVTLSVVLTLSPPVWR
jgi:hypothetical protein